MKHYLVKIWWWDYATVNFDDNYDHETLVSIIQENPNWTVIENDDYEVSITPLDVSEDFAKWFDCAKWYVEDYDYEKHNTVRIIWVA